MRLKLYALLTAHCVLNIFGFRMVEVQVCTGYFFIWLSFWRMSVIRFWEGSSKFINFFRMKGSNTLHELNFRRFESISWNTRLHHGNWTIPKYQRPIRIRLQAQYDTTYDRSYLQMSWNTEKRWKVSNDNNIIDTAVYI